MSLACSSKPALSGSTFVDAIEYLCLSTNDVAVMASREREEGAVTDGIIQFFLCAVECDRRSASLGTAGQRSL